MLFKTQALRVLDRPIHEVTTFYSLRLIDSVIKADVDFIDYDEDFFSNWIESMSLSDVAEIIMKHFGKKMDMGKTLNQAFIEISFCYSLDDDYYELESSQKWTIYFMIKFPWEMKQCSSKTRTPSYSTTHEMERTFPCYLICGVRVRSRELNYT